MPRTARIKSEEGVYHIMVKSISDVPLFRNNDDKDKYLQLIKKYQNIFLFKIYAYCIMTTHGHLIIDCCGADISKIMKSINQCYSSYFNRKYSRCGHVFQDRFKSILVHDEKYLITLSLYIHNNPKDIRQYKNKVEKYKYSSLGIYLGITKDRLEIVDTDFILAHFSANRIKGRKVYLNLINRISDSSESIDIDFKLEKSECRNERKILIRNFSPEKIMNFVSKYTKTNFDIHIKFSHANTEQKSLSVLIMRSLCNMSFKEICNVIGNITSAGLSRLYEKGYNLITTNEKYKTIIGDIITEFCA